MVSFGFVFLVMTVATAVLLTQIRTLAYSVLYGPFAKVRKFAHNFRRKLNYLLNP